MRQQGTCPGPCCPSTSIYLGASFGQILLPASWLRSLTRVMFAWDIKIEGSRHLGFDLSRLSERTSYLAWPLVEIASYCWGWAHSSLATWGVLAVVGQGQASLRTASFGSIATSGKSCPARGSTYGSDWHSAAVLPWRLSHGSASKLGCHAWTSTLGSSWSSIYERGACWPFKALEAISNPKWCRHWCTCRFRTPSCFYKAFPFN